MIQITALYVDSYSIPAWWRRPYVTSPLSTPWTSSLQNHLCAIPSARFAWRYSLNEASHSGLSEGAWWSGDLAPRLFQGSVANRAGAFWAGVVEQLWSLVVSIRLHNTYWSSRWLGLSGDGSLVNVLTETESLPRLVQRPVIVNCGRRLKQHGRVVNPLLSSASGALWRQKWRQSIDLTYHDCRQRRMATDVLWADYDCSAMNIAFCGGPEEGGDKQNCRYRGCLWASNCSGSPVDSIELALVVKYWRYLFEISPVVWGVFYGRQPLHA